MVFVRAAVFACALAACDQGSASETHASAPVPAPALAASAPAPASAPPSRFVANAKRPHTIRRRDLLPELAPLEIPTPPLHGIAVEIASPPAGEEWIAVFDADARTVYFFERSGLTTPSTRAKTIRVTPEQASRLAALGETTWREEPVGKEPFVYDIFEGVAVFDGDDAFWATSCMFEPWRPGAAQVLTALSALDPGRAK